MANPTLLINDSPIRFPIWNEIDEDSRWGDIYHGELFTSIYSCYYGCNSQYFAYSAVMGWRKCHVAMGEYGASRAYGKQFAQWSMNSSRHVFYVRRKCRVFKGTKEQFSLYAGDAICTNGNSTAGLTHPDRLLINGWRKNGVWTKTTSDYWCDTDINIGFSSNPTVYGKGF